MLPFCCVGCREGRGEEGRRGGGGGAEASRGDGLEGGCMPVNISPLNNYKFAWYLISICIMDIIGPLRH